MPNSLEIEKDKQVKDKITLTAEKTKEVIKNFSTSTNTLTPEEEQKWVVFREVLISKNDNDPRIDLEFRQLSPAFHANLQKAYGELPMESRNERGFIAFLIGRDASSAADLEFLKSVYEERPCLSLMDCSSSGKEDPHLSGINESTMNYPQLAGLYSIDKKYTDDPSALKDPAKKAAFKALLEKAATYPVPSVANKAQALLKKYF